jgi:hypothetical protein
MSDDAWAQGTFEGLERAQRRRIAAWTPLERFSWLEDTVAELEQRGLLARWRERKQAEVLAAWERGERPGPDHAAPGTSGA